MTNPTPLSPAAQAVLQAFDYARDGEYIDGEWVVNERAMLGAALRAAADHGEVVEIRTASGMFELDAVIRLSDLRAIADELEGQQ